VQLAATPQKEPGESGAASRPMGSRRARWWSPLAQAGRSQARRRRDFAISPIPFHL
jgi:hypothetical protein